MRTCDLALAAALTLTLASQIHATPTALLQGGGQDSAPASVILPQAGSDGLTLDLRDLSDLEALEPLLFRAALQAGPDLHITVVGGSARLGKFTIKPSDHLSGSLLILDGSADVSGRLDGNLVAVDADVILHPGAMIVGDVLAYNGQVHDLGGEVTGDIRTLSSVSVAPRADEAPAAPHPESALMAFLRRSAGLTGVFLSLVVLGFGVIMFARPNLEVVADTVSHSFGRSFVVGLLGEILLLPTFGMIVVGLFLSVAGILLLPFAVIVYGLLVVLLVVGGYLAVAHAMGETFVRRKMAAGAAVGSPNSYRYMFGGLVALMVLWVGWVLFGWVPVAGPLVQAVAVLVTWLLGTAGFGAALLSRAGIRENFTGRILPPEAMTDEYLWATPQFGVPAARRPIGRTPPPL